MHTCIQLHTYIPVCTEWARAQSSAPAAPPASEEPDAPASEDPVAPPAADKGEGETDPAQEPKPEGEGEEDHAQEEIQEISSELASWSEEDIKDFIGLLTQELTRRQPPPAPEAVPPPPPAAPAAAPEMAPPPADAPAQSPELSSMKKDMDEMKKSMESLKKENEALKKSMKSPINKPAASNANINVATKTSPTEAATPSKENVLLVLETLHKSGNKLVDRDLIWSANHAKTPEEVKLIVDLARLKGIKI